LSGELDEGRQVYEQALNLGATDKRVHYGYAKLLLDLDGDGGTIEHHLRRAFTKGDRNFEAQYWYARQLYVNGKIDEALEMFRVLGNCRLDPDVKRRVRGVIKEAGREKTFTGRVTKVESSYALIERDGPSDYVFLHISNVEGLLWSQLSLGMRLRFSIGFTFRGTAAINVEAE
jgi:cold shock CspA family protein